MEKVTAELYKKWKKNIRVAIWGNPLKVEKPNNCPELNLHERCVGDYSECPYWMGYDSSGINQAYWGDELSGCCGKLLLDEAKVVIQKSAETIRPSKIETAI